MNAALLLEHYAQIADAPDAIARLRRFILDLAVRGKLVEQDPNDEPASELLKRIAAERARLVKVGEAQKDKDLSPAAEDAEFDLPQSWSWVRLGSITSYIQRGKSPTYAEGDGLPVVSQKCVQWSGLNLGAARLIIRQSLEKYEKIRFLQDGDLLWNSTGTGTIGRIIRVENVADNLVCDSHVTVVRCLCVLAEYIRIWLRSDHVYGVIEDRAAGSTNQVELTAQMATNQVVPLPPLTEQHRIVANVDELMALCDQLEAARAEREAGRDKLTLSTLAKLNEPDPETLADDARFALEHLEPLTKRTDQIKQLRQAILNLAVRGGLSADDPWSQMPRKLGTVATLQNGYAFKSQWFAKSGVRLLRNANVGHGNLNWADKVRLPEEMTSEFERFSLNEGDVVLSLDRPFIVSGTKVARIKRADLPALLLQRVGRFVTAPDISKDYLYLWVISPHFSSQVDPGRSNGVPHISSKQVEAAQIYLPPLAEQHRIVAKVDELMALCDQLEAKLVEGEQTRSKLLEALLHKALEPVSTISSRELEVAECQN